MIEKSIKEICIKITFLDFTMINNSNNDMNLGDFVRD